MNLSKKRYLFLGYTILFAILCIIVFHPFYKNDLSLVWGLSGQDGLSQHLSSLIYYGEYIRNFFSHLVHGNFHLPMWDNSIGFGSDILTTLNYYAIGDPLNLVYAFANKHNAQTLYSFMTIFRAYLAGISFIIFGCYFKKNSKGILLGSLTYVFSGVFLVYGIRHPFFLNPIIYFPLLIVGVEKIFRKERPYLFTIMVAISAMSNFYFFYMLTVCSVIYALIRFPVYKQDGFFKTVGRFALWYILGVGLSMIILLPIVIGFMGNARSESSMNYFSIFLYQKSHYISMIEQSIGYRLGERATSLNFIPLAYCSSIALFLKKSKERFAYKTSLIVAVVCTLFPILGYVLHAFSYPMNRWSFALALIIASILTEMYDDLLHLTLSQFVGIFVGCLFYCIIYLRFATEEPDIKYAAFVLILTVIVLIILNVVPLLSRFHFHQLILVGLTFVSISISGFGHYSSRISPVMENYVPNNKAYDILCKNEASILHSAKTENTPLDRVETLNKRIPNWGIVDHIPTTTNYYSITDKNVSDSLQELGLTQYQYKFKFKKLDLRQNLLNLYHVKYIITKTNNQKKIPAGYQLLKTTKDLKLYENQNILPFGYTYDNYINKKDYDALNSAQKEQALVENAIIEDNDQITGLKKASVPNIPTKDVFVNYQHKKSNTLDTKESVTLKIPKKYLTKHCYLYLQDVRSIPFTGNRNHILYSGKNNTTFSVKIMNHNYVLYNSEKNSAYDTGSRNYLVAIDTSKIKNIHSGHINLRFTFTRPNTYKFGKISIVPIDKKQQKYALSQLRSNPHLTNISYDGANHFSGDIKTKDDRILCIPFAYSKGWRATDHGKSIKLMKVNGMFCGLYLKAGDHNIKLTYTTPGLKIGACISLVSLIILIMLILHEKKQFAVKK